MPPITDLKQIESLVSATRQEIMDAMQIAGPASIKEIADLLGRAPDSLYYHFRLLQKVELLKEVDVRPGGRREEVVYDATIRPLAIDMEQGGDEGRRSKVRQAVLKIATAFLRLGERGFRTAVESGQATLHGTQRNAAAGRVTTWLTGEEIHHVETQLRDLLDYCRERRAQGEGQLYAFTYALNPQTPVTRDRQRSGKRCDGKQQAEAQTTKVSPTPESSEVPSSPGSPS